jgi:GNAT superfamily N-acetyltransferase
VTAFARSAAGLAEALWAVGTYGRDTEAIRRDDAVGARVPWAEDNHWLDAAIVPVGATPPIDDPALPHCLWIESGKTAGGRRELPEIAMPAMALELTDQHNDGVEEVPLSEIGGVNDRAYGGSYLGPALAALPATFGRAYAVRADGRPVSVAAAIDLGDDVSVQWVATDPDHRRQGLSTRVMRALLSDARCRGRKTASLQASPDGLPLYERLGFRTVGLLHAHVR